MLLERRDLVREQVEPASVGREVDVADLPPSAGEPLPAGSVGSNGIEVGESVGFGHVPDPILAVPATAIAARSADPRAVARGFERGDLARGIHSLQEAGLVVAA